MSEKILVLEKSKSKLNKNEIKVVLVQQKVDNPWFECTYFNGFVQKDSYFNCREVFQTYSQRARDFN